MLTLFQLHLIQTKVLVALVITSATGGATLDKSALIIGKVRHWRLQHAISFNKSFKLSKLSFYESPFFS